MNNVVRPYIHRLLQCPDVSFFLFGPRGTGKSTWLRHVLPGALFLDLLDASLFLEMSRDPHRLEAMAGGQPNGSWIVLDEIQKIPSLLDEVHRLIESRRWRFALCGSSARKLRRGGANLLAGRAITLNMEGFSAAELGKLFDLSSAIEWGSLPVVQRDPGQAPDILEAYLDTHIREEIRQEGLLRNVPPFMRFIAVAGQMNGQVVNMQNIARDAGAARSTVESYFSIIVDTLLGHFLPAWRAGIKVREAAHPKFYWFDPGLARAAAGRARDPLEGSVQGFALETQVYHELRVYNQVSRKHRPVHYYRTPAGVEVDFVVESSRSTATSIPHIVAIEVKRASSWNRVWEKPLLSLKSADRVKADRLIGVYSGQRSYRFGPVEVMPFERFCELLHKGDLF
jgi:predicted AAA+ superfamily ATPase